VMVCGLVSVPGGGHLVGGRRGFYTFLGELVEVHTLILLTLV